MSPIADVFQKMIFESCTLYHIMPFAKIIGPVEKKWLKVDFNRYFLDLNFEVFPPWKHAKSRSCCFHVFKGEIYQTSNEEKIVKTFIKHCLKDING